jgi:hypothetical protein
MSGSTHQESGVVPDTVILEEVEWAVNFWLPEEGQGCRPVPLSHAPGMPYNQTGHNFAG